MALARTSFLEAVNQVLRMMGEAPINSLNGQYGLAQQAQDMLNDISRKIQSDGWSFNTDREVPLAVNALTGEIGFGPSVSRVMVEPYNFPNYDVVQRGNRLYNRRDQTYTFDQNAGLKADLTYFLDWEELPEYARSYIAVKAGRHLQESIIGSADLTRINMAAEAEARAIFIEEETVVSQHNMLRGNPNLTDVFMTYMPAQALRR